MSDRITILRRRLADAIKRSDKPAAREIKQQLDRMMADLEKRG